LLSSRDPGTTKRKRRRKTKQTQNNKRRERKIKENQVIHQLGERGQKRKETRAGASPVPTPDSYLYTSAPF
jgi:hypothetical protein